MYCDNEAVVQALNSGRVRDPVLARGLRELSFHLSVNECKLRAVHLTGTANRSADLLSRWHLHEDKYAHEFHIINIAADLTERIVP